MKAETINEHKKQSKRLVGRYLRKSTKRYLKQKLGIGTNILKRNSEYNV